MLPIELPSFRFARNEVLTFYYCFELQVTRNLLRDEQVFADNFGWLSSSHCCQPGEGHRVGASLHAQRFSFQLMIPPSIDYRSLSLHIITYHISLHATCTLRRSSHSLTVSASRSYLTSHHHQPVNQVYASTTKNHQIFPDDWWVWIWVLFFTMMLVVDANAN